MRRVERRGVRQTVPTAESRDRSVRHRASAKSQSAAHLGEESQPGGHGHSYARCVPCVRPSSGADRLLGYFKAALSPVAVTALVVLVPANFQRQVPAEFAVTVVFSLPVLSVVTVLTVEYVEAPDFLNCRATRWAL